jgi:hypothetical protein
MSRRRSRFLFRRQAELAFDRFSGPQSMSGPSSSPIDNENDDENESDWRRRFDLAED